MTQYLSGNETGERESLLDTITIRSAYQVPFIAQLPHETISNRVTEYLIDEPFQASESVRDITLPHTNTRLEGADFTYRTPFFPVRLRTIAEVQHFGMEMSNTDRTVNMAGTDTTWDYRAGQLYTMLLNSIDNTTAYGMGSPETGGGTAAAGPTTAGDERMTQGLIYWAAWTGLERAAGSALNAINDPYGIAIPSSMWSVFYNAQHKNLTQDLFYNNIMTPSMNAGADWDTSPWIFQVGYRTMARVARFLIADGAIPLNDRNRQADDAMGTDYLSYFRFPSGQVVGFRTNRWLNESGDTWTIDNSDYTPGAPASPGSAGSLTMQGDQTILGYEPGSVSLCWLREPGFRRVETTGDFSRVAAVAEFAPKVRHPLCVAGGANLLD